MTSVSSTDSSTTTTTTTTSSTSSSSTIDYSSSSDIDWDALIEAAVLQKQLPADRISSKITENETKIEILHLHAGSAWGYARFYRGDYRYIGIPDRTG